MGRAKPGPCPRCNGKRQKKILRTGLVRTYCWKCWSEYCSVVQRKLKYGLDAAQIAEMRQQQNDKCPLCLSPLSKFAVDHDHQTGRIRGLLCVNCNTWLSKFEKPGYASRAAEYLREAS